MSILTNALKIVDGVTKVLKFQSTITFERYLSEDEYGAESYGAAVPLSVIQELKQRSVKTPTGELATSTATLTFLDVPALVAATPNVTGGGKEGFIFANDRITLANGSVQPILNVGGFVDGENGRLIPTEVYLG
jgi:hypothetical protein